jgi:hypothetical protein
VATSGCSFGESLKDSPYSFFHVRLSETRTKYVPSRSLEGDAMIRSYFAADVRFLRTTTSHEGLGGLPYRCGMLPSPVIGRRSLYCQRQPASQGGSEGHDDER